MFGLSAIPAFIQGVGMFFLPHSPRWLIVNGQDEKVLYDLEIDKKIDRLYLQESITIICLKCYMIKNQF